MRKWGLSGSLRRLGTESRGSSRAWGCAGPTQGEEAEHQGERRDATTIITIDRALCCGSRPIRNVPSAAIIICNYLASGRRQDHVDREIAAVWRGESAG